MIRYVQRDIAAPMPPAVVDEEAMRALDGARRALPVQRLVGNGMDYADAVALHDMAARGVPWIAAASYAAEANLRRAEASLADGHRISARSHLFHGAACFRFAQSVLMQDTPQKIQIYRRSLDAFSRAAALAEPAYEKLAIPWNDATLHGWLIRPAGLSAPPVVIVFGGADGWREEYHNGALALRERGLAVLLLDGPGQGETRLLGGLHLRPDSVASAHATVVRFLLEDERVGRSVGIWGNSLGGTLAALAASACPEIAACCVNGGSAEPERVLDRLPRLGDRLRALTGDADAASVRGSLAALALPAEANRIACPLLLLHGGADALFAPEEALAIAEHAPTTDKTVLFWDDGDHCIYNHTNEKHCAIGDWFSDRLQA